jgi:hypothetical protein
VFGAERLSLDAILVALEALDDDLLDVHAAPAVRSFQRARGEPAGGVCAPTLSRAVSATGQNRAEGGGVRSEG